MRSLFIITALRHLEVELARCVLVEVMQRDVRVERSLRHRTLPLCFRAVPLASLAECALVHLASDGSKRHVFDLLDTYASVRPVQPDSWLCSLWQVLRRGLSLESAVRRAVAMNDAREKADCEYRLEQVVHVLSCTLACLLWDQAIRQTGWFPNPVEIQLSTLTQTQRACLPAWLASIPLERWSTTIYAEADLFPLSPRLLEVTDWLAALGVQAAVPLCSAWGQFRASLMQVPPRETCSVTVTECYALENAELASDFDTRCARHGLPHFFPRPFSPGRDAFFVDVRALDVLPPSVAEDLADWLLDKGDLFCCVAVSLDKEKAVDDIAHVLLQAGLAVSPHAGYLLVASRPDFLRHAVETLLNRRSQS